MQFKHTQSHVIIAVINKWRSESTAGIANGTATKAISEKCMLSTFEGHNVTDDDRGKGGKEKCVRLCEVRHLQL